MKHSVLTEPKFIVVGCGDHFRSILAPSLNAIVRAHAGEVVATVDVKDNAGTTEVCGNPQHIVRARQEPLPKLLAKYRDDNSVVILAHDHSMHYGDAVALVESGFRVIVEKPYALRFSAISGLRDLQRRHTNRIALAEYYLMMKSAPLLHGYGLTNPDSFLVSEQRHLKSISPKRTVGSSAGILSRIGRVRFVCVDVLEGKGKTGRLDHRGRHYADTRVGIGVILDLGIHALAPLMSLESRIGRLRRESLVRLRTAICGRFLRSVQRRYKVPSPFVPETYAELLLQTTTGVRVLISLGKYLPKGENQRRLLLVGSEGVAILDMSSCTLSLGLRDQCPATILKSPKLKDSKYVAVLRCCLEYLQGRSPFKFDEFDICLRANELALHAYARSRCRGRARKKYATGSPPGAVFGNARELSAGDS